MVDGAGQVGSASRSRARRARTDPAPVDRWRPARDPRDLLALVGDDAGDPVDRPSISRFDPHAVPDLDPGQRPHDAVQHRFPRFGRRQASASSSSSPSARLARGFGTCQVDHGTAPASSAARPPPAHGRAARTRQEKSAYARAGARHGRPSPGLPGLGGRTVRRRPRRVPAPRPAALAGHGERSGEPGDAAARRLRLLIQVTGAPAVDEEHPPHLGLGRAVAPGRASGRSRRRARRAGRPSPSMPCSANSASGSSVPNSHGQPQPANTSSSPRMFGRLQRGAVDHVRGDQAARRGHRTHPRPASGARPARGCSRAVPPAARSTAAPGRSPRRAAGRSSPWSRRSTPTGRRSTAALGVAEHLLLDRRAPPAGRPRRARTRRGQGSRNARASMPAGAITTWSHGRARAPRAVR